MSREIYRLKFVEVVSNVSRNMSEVKGHAHKLS